MASACSADQVTDFGFLDDIGDELEEQVHGLFDESAAAK